MRWRKEEISSVGARKGIILAEKLLATKVLKVNIFRQMFYQVFIARLPEKF
jgi:hypothetical protein